MASQEKYPNMIALHLRSNGHRIWVNAAKIKAILDISGEDGGFQIDTCEYFINEVFTRERAKEIAAAINNL